MQITTNEVTARAISKNDGPVFRNPNDVTFLVKYAKGYNGPRFLEEGSTQVMSKEVATDFQKRGIGEIVAESTQTTAPAEESATEVGEKSGEVVEETTTAPTADELPESGEVVEELAPAAAEQPVITDEGKTAKGKRQKG